MRISILGFLVGIYLSIGFTIAVLLSKDLKKRIYFIYILFFWFWIILLRSWWRNNINRFWWKIFKGE